MTLRAVTSFRGEVPLQAPRLLPENASQAAVNSRLYTGDLTAFRQFSLTEVLANDGPVQTIALMAATTPYAMWLSWDQDVDVARGTVPGDTTYRTYLTGLDAPRFTNLELATSGGPPYPGTTRLLGVPPPDTVPALVVGVDTTPTTFSVDIYDDCSDLATNWILSSPQIPGGSGSYVSEVSQDLVYGNPPPSFFLEADNNTGNPAYAYRDFGTTGAAVIHASWDVYIQSTGSNNSAALYGLFACGASGDGARIFMFGTLGGSANIGIAIAPDLATGNGATLVEGTGSPASMGTGVWYTIDATLTSNADGTATINANLSMGSVQLASVSTTNTFTIGGLFGPINGKGDDALSVNYDNYLVQASGSLGNTITDIATSYVYTFVNDLGEESAPSLPSVTIVRPDGVAVTVTTPGGLPTGVSDQYYIETKRLYRAATGSTGTAFRFVAEIPLDQTDYIDTLTDSQLGEVLPSDIWDLPPSDLVGILALPNAVMVGFRANELCFSAQNYPHAWPVDYRLSTDTAIVGIGNIDTTVVIGTESFLYIASGIDPANYSMSKFEVPHAASSKRSFAYITGLGVVFSGPQGLMVVRGIGQASNLTEEVFTLRQWEALDPSSIFSVAHDDIYFMFWNNGTTKGCYAVDLRSNGFGVVEMAFHASAAYVDPITDTMYLVLDADYEPENDLLAPSQFLLTYNGGGGTPSGVQPPDFESVTALVRCNGDIVDYSSNHGTMLYETFNVGDSPTPTDPVFSTTSPLLFGQPMLKVGTVAITGGYIVTEATLRIPGAQLALGTAPFTAEGWFWWDGVASEFISWSATGTTDYVSLGYDPDRGRFTLSNATSPDGSTGGFFAPISNALTVNALNFIQLERASDNSMSLYVNGAAWQPQDQPLPNTYANTTLFLLQNLTAYDLFIGNNFNYAGGTNYAGEIRVTTGIALTDHSVPTGAFPSPGYTPPTPAAGINGVTIFEFEGDDTQSMIYSWTTKLWLEQYPSFHSIAQVRAETYTNLVAQFYGDGVLLDEILISGEVEFTLTPPDTAYTKFQMVLIGTDTVEVIQAADDVLELT